jgi:DNA-binding CsgD family transcriptional regulator
MVEDTDDTMERFAEDRAWVKVGARIAVNTLKLGIACSTVNALVLMVCRKLDGSRRGQL